MTTGLPAQVDRSKACPVSSVSSNAGAGLWSAASTKVTPRPTVLPGSPLTQSLLPAAVYPIVRAGRPAGTAPTSAVRSSTRPPTVTRTAVLSG